VLSGYVILGPVDIQVVLVPSMMGSHSVCRAQNDCSCTGMTFPIVLISKKGYVDQSSKRYTG